MTLDEIRRSDADILTPADIAPVLGAHPQWIRMTAKETPELIGYPFTFVGNRMKIPRIGFLNWMKGTTKNPPCGGQAQNEEPSMRRTGDEGREVKV